MKSSIFKNPHNVAVSCMHEHIDTIVAEGNLTPHKADDIHFAINAYHAQNKNMALEAFCMGLNACVTQELNQTHNSFSCSSKTA